MRYGCLIIITLLTITACAHKAPTSQSKRFINYAETLPPITVPAGVTDPTKESYYPVPAVPVTAPIGLQPPLAPPSSKLVVQPPQPN